MVQLLAAVRTGASALEQQSRLAICLRTMLAHADHGFTPPRATNASTAVRKAMAFLREHYQEPVGLDELAGRTGMNGSYLAHAFRKHTGMPSHAFLTRVRIERARSLLICSMPPGRVATEVGFADQSHLHRHFKQICHLTPGE
jgi:transcriptional regulator GlxA family with amidase domain